MSDLISFYVQKEQDSKLLNVFKSFYSQYEKHIFQVIIELRTHNVPINVSKETNNLSSWLNNNLLQMLCESPSFLIDRIQISLMNHTITFIRGERSPIPTPLFDCIQSSSNGNNSRGVVEVTPELKIEIYKYLQEKLCPISTLQQISTNLPKEYEAIVSHHSFTLSKLEELSSNLVAKNHEKNQELDQIYQGKMKALEEGYQKKTDELNQSVLKEKEKLNSEVLLEKEALAVKKTELDNRSSKLDDRDNTHVRREIRDKILEDVKFRINNFGVSKGTNSKRIPVLIGIIFLILCFSVILYNLGNELSSIHKENVLRLEISKSNSTNGTDGKEKQSTITESSAKVIPIDVDKSLLYWVWLKITITSIGLIGTVLYYIKWQNRWADYHATSEFQLQQFQIDINRASWVLESCLEWSNETKMEIPPVLLESITKNLFIGENKDLEKVIHPSDELASAILGSASKVKLNLHGNEVEIDKPGKMKSKSI